MTKTISKPEGAIDLFSSQGFIARLDDNCAGSDLTVVNAARVSFAKQSYELDKNDEKLLNFLAKHKHMSPFRHPQVSFHLKAPEAIMRQAYKHVVGVDWTSGAPAIKDHAWNEISGRYIVYDSVYEPSEFRPQSDDNKQCSEDGDLSDVRIEGRIKDLGLDRGATVRDVYEHAIDTCRVAYKLLLDEGVSKEQARLLMPFATFTEVIWTCSLEAAAHFVNLRTHAGAQWEIREMADAVDRLCRERFPKSFEALINNL